MAADTNPHGISVPSPLRERVEAILRALAGEGGEPDPLMCWHEPERGAVAILGIDGVLMGIMNQWYGSKGRDLFERFLSEMDALEDELHIHHQMIDGSLIGFYATPGA